MTGQALQLKRVTNCDAEQDYSFGREVQYAGGGRGRGGRQRKKQWAMGGLGGRKREKKMRLLSVRTRFRPRAAGLWSLGVSLVAAVRRCRRAPTRPIFDAIGSAEALASAGARDNLRAAVRSRPDFAGQALRLHRTLHSSNSFTRSSEIPSVIAPQKAVLGWLCVWHNRYGLANSCVRFFADGQYEKSSYRYGLEGGGQCSADSFQRRNA
jgi:hypothetical protein